MCVLGPRWALELVESGGELHQSIRGLIDLFHRLQLTFLDLFFQVFILVIQQPRLMSLVVLQRQVLRLGLTTALKSVLPYCLQEALPDGIHDLVL